MSDDALTRRLFAIQADYEQAERDDGDAPEQMPFWDRLGTDETGMATHLPMGVNASGQGPEDDMLAHHIVCWCGDPDCLLTGVLLWAFRLGQTTPVPQSPAPNEEVR